jgi:hypothetical protein
VIRNFENYVAKFLNIAQFSPVSEWSSFATVRNGQYDISSSHLSRNIAFLSKYVPISLHARFRLFFEATP